MTFQKGIKKETEKTNQCPSELLPHSTEWRFIFRKTCRVITSSPFASFSLLNIVNISLLNLPCQPRLLKYWSSQAVEILCLQYNFTGRVFFPFNFIFLAYLQSNIFYPMKLKYSAIEIMHSVPPVSLAADPELHVPDAPRLLWAQSPPGTFPASIPLRIPPYRSEAL